MDVQTENAEPPPSESQPSGKIRKGFKLFGKRKPGNIFSIRNKSEGNNKSPLHRSKTLDVPDSAANDSEQDQEREKIQGDEEQGEEEPLGEDGVYAAAPPRTSISSACSAKSLGFLSILRGGRRGLGDRRVQTISQPSGRQRRGIKGLFGNVKFRSKDKDEKEEKEDVPPSPLLMSSRSNSVEIIKEDLTLTPKSQPRSLGSPGTESSEPTNKSLTVQDSSATSPSKTVTPGGNESQAAMQAAMVPGETSLSTLLADISSLLTFDSISGGDIMADVEAEWGKASGAITPVVDTSPSYTSFSKPLSSFSTSLSPKTASPNLTTQPSSNVPSSPMKPSSIITTLTKSSTLTTPTIKSSTEMAINVTTTVETKPSAAPLTNTSSPIMSSPPITMKTTLAVTSVTTAPPSTPATETKAPSTANKLASEQTETPKTASSISSFVTTAPAAIAKTTPVTQSLPVTSALTQSFTPKFDLTSSLPSASFNKVKATVSVTSSVTAQPSPPAPLISSKMTTTEGISATVSLSTALTATPAPSLCTPGMRKTSQSAVNEISSSEAVSFSHNQATSLSTTAFKSESPLSTASVYLNGTLPTSANMSVPSKSSLSPDISQNFKAASLSVSKEAPLSVSQPKLSAAPSEMPSFFSKTPFPTSQISASSPQIPLASTMAPPHPALSQTSSCPVSSGQLSRGGSGKKRESDPCSVDGSPKRPDALQQDSHQIKEDKKRTSQGHSTGLSKIPVVGGGRVGKIPVRVNQHAEEEAIRDTDTTPPEEPTPHFNSHDIGSKDKIPNSEVAVATSKHSQEEPQTQAKAATCSPRDSKIPVKHGSQIPQAKTKIPVSKVPVRRAGAKPTAQSSSTQIRK